MQARRVRTDRSQTFFEPVQFYLQLANLAVHHLRRPMRLHRFGAALSFEKGLRLLLDRLLPLPRLHWVNPVLLADLVYRLDPRKASRPTFALNSGVCAFRFFTSLITSRSSRAEHSSNPRLKSANHYR